MNPVVADRPLKPLGFEQFEVTASSQGLPSIPKTAAYAYVQAQGGLLRWRDDGTAPDGNTGHLMDDTDDLFYIGDLHKFFVIKDAAEVASVYLSVSYYEVE